MTEKLGATGKFPDGKLNKDDEGELAFRVGRRDGYVVIDFGKPVKWMALPPGSAIELANHLIRNVNAIKGN